MAVLRSGQQRKHVSMMFDNIDWISPNLSEFTGIHRTSTTLTGMRWTDRTKMELKQFCTVSIDRHEFQSLRLVCILAMRIDTRMTSTIDYNQTFVTPELSTFRKPRLETPELAGGRVWDFDTADMSAV